MSLRKFKDFYFNSFAKYFVTLRQILYCKITNIIHFKIKIKSSFLSVSTTCPKCKPFSSFLTSVNIKGKPLNDMQILRLYIKLKAKNVQHTFKKVIVLVSFILLLIERKIF